MVCGGGKMIVSGKESKRVPFYRNNVPGRRLSSIISGCLDAMYLSGHSMRHSSRSEVCPPAYRRLSQDALHTHHRGSRQGSLSIYLPNDEMVLAAGGYANCCYNDVHSSWSYSSYHLEGERRRVRSPTHSRSTVTF